MMSTSPEFLLNPRLGTSEGSHAPLSPSSAFRWTACPISPRLARTLPSPPAGDAAMAGTLLHSTFERRLYGGPGLQPAEVAELERLGVRQTLAFSILDAGIEATQALLKQHNIRHIALETRVDPGAAIGRSDFWGTADLLGANEDEKTLVVLDFKTGRHPVAVQDNLQLLSYALGALDTITFEPERIVLAIVQPVAFGAVAQTQSITLDVLDRFSEWIGVRAFATDDPTAQPQPSAEACRFCPARFLCPANDFMREASMT
jgi:hypothetical protein